VEAEGVAPTMLVAFSEGETCAKDETLLPEICRRLVRG